MNDSQRNKEVNLVVEAEAISNILILQADSEQLGEPPTDRLEYAAFKTATASYIARGKKSADICMFCEQKFVEWGEPEAVWAIEAK